jgi:hypothetical protein
MNDVVAFLLEVQLDRRQLLIRYFGIGSGKWLIVPTVSTYYFCQTLEKFCAVARPAPQSLGSTF